MSMSASIVVANVYIHSHNVQSVQQQLSTKQCVYDMYVRTVPRTAVRQIGHSRRVGAQLSQQTR